MNFIGLFFLMHTGARVANAHFMVHIPKGTSGAFTRKIKKSKYKFEIHIQTSNFRSKTNAQSH